ncbi:MAG: nuclease-related domain-containing protein [Acholeplasmataceae bacterium]
MIIIIFVIIVGYFYYLNTPTGKGKTLENRIHRTTKSLAKQLGGLELRDLMFQDDLSTAQIDNLLITSKGLYIIEAKNYNGHIFGSEKQENWTMTVKHVNRKKSKSGKVYTKTHISKHSFYNPIKQNQTHINKILKLMEIHKEIPIHNIVVFGSKAYLRDVTHSNQVFVINTHQLRNIIINQEKSIDKEIEIEKMMTFVDDMIYHNIIDKKERRSHVKRIIIKYKK